MEDKSALPDFFEAHPEAIAIEAFRNLKEKKENASQILYYIKFMVDPQFDHLRVLRPEDRTEELKKWLGIGEKDLFNSKGEMFAIIAKAEKWFKENWLDPTARLFAAHTEKVHQCTKIVEDYEIDSPTAMTEYKGIIDTFHTIKTTHDKSKGMFEVERGQKEKHGGGEVSPAYGLFKGIK